MQSTADLAVHILARTPARTLPISHLSLLIEREAGGAGVGRDFVVQAVRARPDLFRLLDPWRGPWRVSRRAGLEGSTLRSRPLGGVKDEPWVLLLEPPADSELDPPARMLQESMLAAGRRVDEHSVTALARWLRMSLEVVDVAPALQRQPVIWRVSA
ncbi:MAG: hypothetical protein BMS9Abin29_2059 [Gemmatimonadota bacterium]|nr:MAG: hypothetical protein BMS9Abin29_2059 [Gemmatimonadota bacterium]